MAASQTILRDERDPAPQGSRALESHALADGFAMARRGGALAAGSGLLLLALRALARTSYGAESLPELRALLGYDDLVLHGALWLGFVLHIGGLWRAGAAASDRTERAVLLGMGALSGLALTLVGLTSHAGIPPRANDPPGGAAALAAAVLGTVALSGGLLAAVQIAPRLTSPWRPRRATLLAVLLLLAAAINAEAVAGIVAPSPVAGLGSCAAAAALDLTALFWLSSLLLKVEQGLRQLER